MKTKSTGKCLSFIGLMAGILSVSAPFASRSEAKLNVVTTITDLRAITAEVGGDLINVDAIAKGTQDPHFIEAKPSFMTKASRADLIILIGLDLEVGWVPSIIRGARNPKLNVGQPGYLEIGPELDPLEVAKGSISRSEGDVHPFGNPHVNLDPIRMGKAAVLIGKRLSELDPEHAEQYKKNAAALQTRLSEKTKSWESRIKASGVKKVVTYHKTLTYFLERFALENPAILEPKPGIPPTSGHIIEVIKLMKEQKILLVLVENYFDATVANRIKQELPQVRAVTVPVAVDGAPGIAKIDDLYEHLVKAIESGE